MIKCLKPFFFLFFFYSISGTVCPSANNQNSHIFCMLWFIKKHVTDANEIYTFPEIKIICPGTLFLDLFYNFDHWFRGQVARPQLIKNNTNTASYGLPKNMLATRMNSIRFPEITIICPGTLFLDLFYNFDHWFHGQVARPQLIKNNTNTVSYGLPKNMLATQIFPMRFSVQL